MHFLLTHLTLLASLLLLPTHAQTTCTQSPTNFQVYITNSAGATSYGALGGPCKSRGGCGVFFSVDQAGDTTYFNITSQGFLTIASATSGPTAHPNRPKGYIASVFTRAGAVLFWKPTTLQGTGNGTKKMKCSIQAASAGEGTCDLVCQVGIRKGFSVDPNDSERLYVGNGPKGSTDVDVKVVFS